MFIDIYNFRNKILQNRFIPDKCFQKLSFKLEKNYHNLLIINFKSIINLCQIIDKKNQF